MNSSGQLTEIQFSLEFHSKGIPLLVSPLLLRSRLMGQIDLGRLQKLRGEWVVEIAEVKSSKLGEEQMEKNQKQRLMMSGRFLSALFGHRTKLLHLTKNQD